MDKLRIVGLKDIKLPIGTHQSISMVKRSVMLFGATGKAFAKSQSTAT